jgi:hypothetical protein
VSAVAGTEHAAENVAALAQAIGEGVRNRAWSAPTGPLLTLGRQWRATRTWKDERVAPRGCEWPQERLVSRVFAVLDVWVFNTQPRFVAPRETVPF